MFGSDGRLNDETQSDEISPHGSKTETSDILAAPIPGSYGSTPVQEKTVDRFYVPFCGLVFYAMAFFGLVCVHAVRETLSVAIVAMVNQTTLTEMDIAMTIASDQAECPIDPELEHEGGEFNWDRNQEAIVLSAFFYGYVVTQVRSVRTSPLWAVGRSSPYCKDVWERYCCLTTFFRLSIRALFAKAWPYKVARWCADGEFLAIFCVLYFQ